MCRGPHPGLLSNKKKAFTLVEMLVVLGIMAVLASIAVPFAQTMVRRSNEMELRSALRVVRAAIDKFNLDWTGGKISKFCDCAGDDGYPRTLKVLTDGVDMPGPVPKKIKYLRRVPRDPFADQALPADEQWGLRSYIDDPESRAWGGQDVYDIYTKTDRKAGDGSKYADW
jgi:general secretion pathway protein G